MESKDQSNDETFSSNGHFNPDIDTKKSKTASRFLKKSNSSKIAEFNNNMQGNSSKDVLIPENVTSTDRHKFQDIIQTSPIKRHFYREKHRFKINSEKLIKDENSRDEIHSDTLNNVIIAANYDYSLVDSEDSGLSEPEDMQQEDSIISSPVNTDIADMRIQYREYNENIGIENEIFDSSPNLDVHQSKQMLNLSLAEPGTSQNKRYYQSSDENRENKSAILRYPKISDLSKLSSELKTSEEIGRDTDNFNSDNDFMEADVPLADEAKQPALRTYESSFSDPEGLEFKKPCSPVKFSPVKTTINNNFNFNECRDHLREVNIAHDIPILDVQQSIQLLKQLLPKVDQSQNAWYQQSVQTPDDSLVNESMIWKLEKIEDLSKISSERETDDEIVASNGKGLPDDEFMEADRYHGDKGKQPASKRYAYKKKSKSNGNQSLMDSKMNTNSHMESDIKTDSSSSRSNFSLPSNAPLSSQNGVTSCIISETRYSESLKGLNFTSEDIKKAATERNFHGYVLKRKARKKKLSNLPADYRNYNNNNLFRKENYFESQYSEEDYNLQKVLLLSLQSINTSKTDDDSDVDIVS